MASLKKLVEPSDTVAYLPCFPGSAMAYHLAIFVVPTYPNGGCRRTSRCRILFKEVQQCLPR